MIPLVYLANGNKKALAVLATGSGKTYLACLASYRLLNYTPTKRILFLVDRNNLARQTETEFSLFDRTEKQKPLSEIYEIKRLKKKEDIDGDIVISTIQKLFAVLTGQAIGVYIEMLSIPICIPIVRKVGNISPRLSFSPKTTITQLK